MSLIQTPSRADILCLAEPHRIETLNFDHLADELADGAPPPSLTPERICVQDLIVVATEPESGRYLGLLGARYEMAANQPYLRLDMACVAPATRGQRLMTRLLAQAALVSARHASVLAACTGTAAWFRALRHFAFQVDQAAFYPTPAGAPIALRTALTARQIAAIMCPEHRFDLATGVVHGKWPVTVPRLQRHSSADAWCEAARDAMPMLSERLLAVVDLRGVPRTTLRSLAG